MNSIMRDMVGVFNLLKDMDDLLDYLKECENDGCYMPDVYGSPFVYFTLLKFKQQGLLQLKEDIDD